MDNKIIKNYFYNLSYQILVIIVPLITTPYISRVLGAKGIGTFSYTNSIVQYFILFGCIGLNLYGQREIAYVQHNKIDRNRVFYELVILRFISVSLSILVYFFTMIQSEKYGFVFLLMTLDVIASMVDISWFFQGIEDFKKIVIRNFIVKIIGVILIFLFVKNQDDIYLYILCHSVTLLLGNLSMWVYIPKLVGKLKINTLRLGKHIKPALILFFPQIATSVYTTLDKTMIGALTDLETEVAFYEQSQKIIRIFLTLVTSLGTVMMPRIANLFVHNNSKKINEYLNSSFTITIFLVFPMCFGLIALSSNIVPWFFGDGYEKVVPNMVIIAPILVFIALSNIIGNQYLLPLGKQKQYTISVILGMLVNVVLNFILIPWLLSLGAAIATVIAEFSVTLIQFYFIKNIISIKLIFRNCMKYIVMSFIMFIPTFTLSIILESSMLNSLIIAIIGICIYITMLLVSKDRNLQLVKNHIKIRK